MGNLPMTLDNTIVAQRRRLPTALFEAAHVLMTRLARWSKLKRGP
jgi:hypothetical protein